MPDARSHREDPLSVTADHPWLASYPPGVPVEIDSSGYNSLTQLLEDAFRNHARSCAAICMDSDLSFAQLDELSASLGAWLQSRGLKRGARVALMMPNVLQYPVVIAAVLRAGLVVVNVNPLYTARELEHQLKDSGAKAIFILGNFAHTLEKCIAATPIQHVVLCAMGDRLGLLKGALVNYVVRRVKKLVPEFHLPGAVRFNHALAQGARAAFKKVDIQPDDMALRSEE